MLILLTLRRLAPFSAKAAVAAVFFAIFLLLSACGGGGGGSAVAPPDVGTPTPPVVNPQPTQPPVPLPRDSGTASAAASSSGYAIKAAVTVATPSPAGGAVSVVAVGVTATGTHIRYFVRHSETDYSTYDGARARQIMDRNRCSFMHMPGPGFQPFYAACVVGALNTRGEYPEEQTVLLSVGVAEHRAAISVISVTVPEVNISAFAIVTAMGQSANISGNLRSATTGLHNARLPFANSVHIAHSHYDCLDSTLNCYRWLSGNGRVGDEATGQAAELMFVNHVANNDIAYVWAALPVTISSRANGFWASAPRAFPQLREKWIVAAAANVAEVNTAEGARLFAALRDRRASCYGIEDWCLVANAETPHEAAAKTTGALALLKQRNYAAPMSVLVEILLATADEVRAGARDNSPALELLGRGVLNVDAAVATADGMRTMDGFSLQRAVFNIPPAFSGLAKELQDESIAVRYLGNRYYDHPLANLVRAEKTPPLQINASDVWGEDNIYRGGNFFTAHDGGGNLRAAGMKFGALEIRHLWNAASSALRDGENLHPFFAANPGREMQMRLSLGGGFSGFAANGNSGSYRQNGVLFAREFGRFGVQSSFSRIDEKGALLGGKWGGVAPLLRGGKSKQMRAKISFAASDDWTVFAAMEKAETRADVGGIVGRIDGLRAFGWRAGFSAKNILRGGDILRFAFARETEISGAAVLQLPKSAADGYRIVERKVKFASGKTRVIAAAYGFAPSENTRLSFAAAHRINGESKMQMEWRLRF